MNASLIKYINSLKTISYFQFLFMEILNFRSFIDILIYYFKTLVIVAKLKQLRL